MLRPRARVKRHVLVLITVRVAQPSNTAQAQRQVVTVRVQIWGRFIASLMRAQVRAPTVMQQRHLQNGLHRPRHRQKAHVLLDITVRVEQKCTIIALVGVRRVVVVSTVRPAQHRAATSLRVAMERVQVHLVRRYVQRIATLMQVHPHVQRVIATMQTVVIQQNHMQAWRLVRLPVRLVHMWQAAAQHVQTLVAGIIQLNPRLSVKVARVRVAHVVH